MLMSPSSALKKVVLRRRARFFAARLARPYGLPPAILLSASSIARLLPRELYIFCLWRRADAGINQTKGT